MKITVGERQIFPEGLIEAIKDAEAGDAPIQLIVANGSDVQTRSIDYHGGFRYPHLVRDASHPDYLSEILRPLAPQAK